MRISGTDIIGFGTYVDGDVFYSWHTKTMSFLKLFLRFHKVARQLRSRYSGRQTLEIEDEYDVQDLLHALLHLYFDDIRAEEWTPSYAGKCARVDFVLK